MKTINFSFKWLIKNYSAVSKLTCENGRLESPKFKANKQDNKEWHLELSEHSLDSHRVLNVVVNDDLLNGVGKEIVVAKCACYLLNPNATKVDINTATYRQFTTTKASFIQYVALETFKQHLSDDVLTIFCDISMFDTQHTTTSYKDLEYEEVPECSIADDFAALLHTGDFSDVILCVEGQELEVHKNVLAARSQVFRAMFEHSLTESETGRVDIEDMEYATAKLMLEYIYTGKTPELSVDVATGLLAAGDRYGLDRLKGICEQFLGKSLEISSCVYVLMLADLHSAQKLRKSCIEFIKGNSESIIGSEQWDQMIQNKPHIVTELFRAFASMKV